MDRSPLRFNTCAPSRFRHAIRFVLAFALLAAAAPGFLFGATFTATLDRDTVTVGDRAVLTLTFEGGQPRSIPSPPSTPDLQVMDQGTSQSVNIVNGQMSSTISENFVLTPTKPGEYTIPAMTTVVNGQRLTSRPLTLRAVKPSASANDNSGQQLAFMKLFVPDTTVYVGQVVEVQLQLFVRSSVANAEGILQGLEQYNGSPVKADGFTIMKTAPAQRRRVQVGNGIYTVATSVTALAPVKTGSLSIGSINASFVAQLPVQGQSDDSFPFGGFFQQYRQQRINIAAEPATLNVLPLPQENVPASFSGAVGEYSLNVSASPTNVAVGDPITVRVQVTGHGALDALSLPSQNDWTGFKAYPPTTKVDTTDSLGVEGTKTFEEVLVPQNSDIKEVPAVAFSFFDPRKKTYETLTGPAVPLIVRPGGSTPAPVVASGARNSNQTPPPTRDIVAIKQHLGTLAEIEPPLIEQPWFLALQGAPVLALFSVVFWRKRSESLANNPRLRRQRQVAQILRAGLADLRRLSAENDSDAFFATLFRLLQEQLGERLDLPASSITESIVEEQLLPRGLPEATLNGIQELFQMCNLARYAPIKSSQELAAIIPKLEDALAQLKEWKA